MKRRVDLLLLFCLIALSASAQQYKKMRVGVGMGMATPGTTVPGFLIYLEPSYRIGNTIVIGIRVESVMNSGTSDERIPVLGSYSLNGQYYLSRGNFRPFVGLGAGIYTANRGAFMTCNCDGALLRNGFGFYPRVGFDFHHFTLLMDVNIVQSMRQKIYYDDPFYLLGYQNMNPGYFSIKAGVTIGGGRKAQ